MCKQRELSNTSKNVCQLNKYCTLLSVLAYEHQLDTTSMLYAWYDSKNKFFLKKLSQYLMYVCWQFSSILKQNIVVIFNLNISSFSVMNLPTVSKHPYQNPHKFSLFFHWSTFFFRPPLIGHRKILRKFTFKSGFLKELPGSNRRLPEGVFCPHRPLLCAWSYLLNWFLELISILQKQMNTLKNKTTYLLRAKFHLVYLCATPFQILPPC